MHQQSEHSVGQQFLPLVDAYLLQAMENKYFLCVDRLQHGLQQYDDNKQLMLLRMKLLYLHGQGYDLV
ncbi:hypothetical protein A8M42_29835 [Escherichia coli]|nr:hypothetical protein A8M42_29835 [Escherichia coli]